MNLRKKSPKSSKAKPRKEAIYKEQLLRDPFTPQEVKNEQQNAQTSLQVMANI